MQVNMKNRNGSLTKAALITVLLLVSALSGQGQSDESRSGQWRTAGQNLSNTWSQPAEHSISPANVNGLTPKWVFTTGGDVSATPTVDGNAVYFPDWGGNLFAVEKDTGRLIWSHKISEYDGVEGAVSRVSPAVDGNQVIIGDIPNSKQAHSGANVISVDRQTGTIQWMTQVDTHPAAIITGSPVVFDGMVYIGISSNEETLALNPAYPCCSFRGGIVALDEKSGAIRWKTFDMPDNGGQPGGYSGGAIWQPPAIDPKRGTLFAATGNNYTAPAAVEACQNATPTANCSAADDFFDTALALDLKSGQIKWSKKLQGFDTFTGTCGFGATRPTPGNPNCPVPDSQDFDFGGAGPNLVGNIVGFGQKSGILVPSGQKITWGAWSALDVATGKILWQTADPTAGTIDTGSVSVANGVMYAGSYSGQMYALHTKTGKILWNFASGGTVIDGPSIVDGTLYWGSGYRNIPPGIGNNKVYAFTLAGENNRGEHSGR
jgi:polyvinyl alcohol dehydrogenase (cytochrome)